jgi:hypothetical protein
MVGCCGVFGEEYVPFARLAPAAVRNRGPRLWGRRGATEGKCDNGPQTSSILPLASGLVPAGRGPGASRHWLKMLTIPKT